MRINKILTSLTLGFTLVFGVAQAQAALLTDWAYDLTSVSLTNFNTDFVSVSTADNGKNQMNFNSGTYNVTIAPNGGSAGDLTFSGNDTSANSENNDALLNQTTSDAPLVNTSATKLADLTFSYRVESVENPGVFMDITYTMPLYTFYDATAQTAYIYYNNSEVSTRGATAITYDGFKYGITGVGLFVDDRALVTLPGAEGDPNLYSGWAINEDTMNNNYSEYVVGEDNSEFFLGAKDNEGDYQISGVFSITNTEVTPPPAPTPEPATMLLTGLGLAGLGLVKRRRNNK